MDIEKTPIAEVINDGNILLVYTPTVSKSSRTYIPICTIIQYNIRRDTERNYGYNDWPNDKDYFYITAYTDKGSIDFGYSYDYKECVKTLETLLEKIYPKKPEKNMITMPN